MLREEKPKAFVHECQLKRTMADKEDIDKEKPIKPLDAADIALLKSYVSDTLRFIVRFNFDQFLLFQGLGPYSKPIKSIEDDITRISKHINDVCGN